MSAYSGVAVAAMLAFVTWNAVTLTYLLVHRPDVQSWLAMTGLICLSWLVLSGVLAAVRARR